MLLLAQPSALIGATATITSSTAVDADYPLTNLHDGWPTEPTRWTTAAQTRIVWDLGAGSPSPTVEGLLIVMHTLAAGATLKVQGNGANAWGAPSYTQDVTVPAWGADTFSLPANIFVDLRTTGLATVGYRFLSILLPDNGSPGADHAIGEVCWIGAWTTLDASAAYPLVRTEIRRLTVNATAYGVEHVIDRGVRQRQVRVTATAISDAERATWLDLIREAGASLAWPVVIYVAGVLAEALWVRLSSETVGAVNEQLDFDGVHDLQLDFLEVQRGLPL